jgi:hypothetical protein
VYAARAAARLSSTVGVRHEVVQVAVGTATSLDHGDVAGFDPTFRRRYPTEACVVRKTVPFGTLTGCEALETKVSLILTMGWQRNCEMTHCTLYWPYRTVPYGTVRCCDC